MRRCTRIGTPVACKVLLLAIFAVIVVSFECSDPRSVSGIAIGSAACATELHNTSFRDENLDSTRFVLLEQLIEENYFRQIRSVVVLKGDRILYENYFNGADREALQDIRSAGKSIASALIGIALDKGYLTDLNQPLLSFFPEYDRTTNWDPRKADITLANTLSMSIGLDLSDGSYGPGSYDNVESYGPNWISDVLSKPMAFDPGSMFDYSSGAASLCGPIIRRVSGMTVPVFADTFLFRPLGITQYRWTPFPDGHVCTSGSFWMRPLDFAKFGLLYLQGGRWNDQQIISRKWVDLSTQERFLPSPLVKVGYGFYWWREEYYFDNRTITCFYAQGNGGNRVHVFPSERIVIAITASAYSQPYMFDQVRAMINKLILPAAILPRGSYEARAGLTDVPELRLLGTAAILLSGLIIWPITSLRRRKSRTRSSRAVRDRLRSGAKVIVWLCALIHFGFILLILYEQSFELFLNTGYRYEIPTLHLVVNWLLTISAGLAAVAMLLALVRKWWATRGRFHFVLVSLSCCYMLYIVYSWDALILAG
jgi:CubicO group peptidase (beta-lactamase class C family)